MDHRTPVTTYVGLDISLAETHICVLDQNGTRLYQGAVPSDPDALADIICRKAPNCERIGMETGATTPWLWRALRGRGLPVICIDARHANRALSMRKNKTDKNDAQGLAELMRIGWFKEANVRSPQTQYVRSLLTARYQLRLSRKDVLNQMRGVVKSFGLFSGSTATRRFPAMVQEIIQDNPQFGPLLAPLLAVHEALTRQIAVYEDELKNIAERDPDARRIMTVPGIGYLVALAFMTAVDDPARFSSSNKLGPYLGLAPRVRQSGEASWSAGIGHAPDKMMRSYLYQAATVVLTKTASWSALKAWGLRVYKRSGFKRAAVAVARKLAIIMHAIWIKGTEFEYSQKGKAA